MVVNNTTEFCILNKKIIMIPGWNQYIFSDYITRMQTLTRRSKILKFCFIIIHNLRLSHLFIKETSKVEIKKIELLLHEINIDLEKLTGFNFSNATLFFPTDTNRYRCYVYLYNEKLECIYFVKITYDLINSSHLLREKDVMSSLNTDHLSFRVPTIVSSKFNKDTAYIVYKCLSKNFISKNGEWYDKFFKIRNQLLGKLQKRKLNECDWWNLLNLNKCRDISYYLSSFKKNSFIYTGLVHGDLTSHNALESKNDLFIIDWEYASTSGPYTVDEVSFYLTKYQKLILKNPLLGLKVILDNFQKNCREEHLEERFLNLKTALGYLSYVGNNQAKLIVKSWSKEYEEAFDVIQ